MHTHTVTQKRWKCKDRKRSAVLHEMSGLHFPLYIVSYFPQWRYVTLSSKRTHAVSSMQKMNADLHSLLSEILCFLQPPDFRPSCSVWPFLKQQKQQACILEPSLYPRVARVDQTWVSRTSTIWVTYTCCPPCSRTGSQNTAPQVCQASSLGLFCIASAFPGYSQDTGPE